MDAQTKDGIENLEKSVSAEDLSEEYQEESSSETAQSDEAGYENAEHDYE